MTETAKGPTVGELREKLRQAEIEAGYWRGRADALESLASQRAQPAGNATLPPELLTALLASKMKEKKDDA